MSSRALVVGIPATELAHFPNLVADRDAAQVSRHLSARGFQVDARTNGCSRDQFVRALKDLRACTRPGDLSLVYFSGHGDRVEDTAPDADEPWDTHLVLSDSKLPDDWFGEDFWPSVHRSKPGSRWVTFADACFSRTALYRLDKDVPVEPLVRATEGTSEVRRLHLSAALDSEAALAVDPVERVLSYATAAFLRALRRSATTTYRAAIDAVAEEATMLQNAGCGFVPAPTLYENNRDSRLSDSPAFAPLSW